MNNQYIRLIILVLLFSIFNQLYSQEYRFNENQDLEGLRMISSSENNKLFRFSIEKFSLAPISVENKMMSQLNYGISFLPGEEGKPELPSISKNILIPNECKVEIRIISSQKEVYENIDISPAARPPIETGETYPPIKGKQYDINEFFPSEIIQLTRTEIRGMQIANIGLSPFQYNPVSKQLIAYSNIEFELIIKESNSTYGEDRFRSPFWDQILSDVIYNTDDVPRIDYSKRNTTQKDLGCDYLIIIPNQEIFASWADTIRRFRDEQGIQTLVLTTEDMGGNTVEDIDSFIDDIYNTWDPVPSAILLLADYGADNNSIISKKFPHPWGGEYVTDNYFSDVTGNNLPDFVISRICATTESELETMINKFIQYESNPPMQAEFYHVPITSVGWDIEKWFQICSASIDGYLQSVLGKEPNRINDVYIGNPNTDPWSTAANTSTITDYFGPNGLNYIPESPADIGGWTGGTTQDIIDAFNTGSFMVFERDHGTNLGWWTPNFSKTDINHLTNNTLLPHVFSIGCSNAEFNNNFECFAEKIHRKADGGALCITALSSGSWSYYNDTDVWGIIDNIWPDFLPDFGGSIIDKRGFYPAFANAAGKYFLSASSWVPDTRKVITQQLFHHLGDAFGVVYTEIPQENNVSYDCVLNTNSTNISIEAEPFSFVGLSTDGVFLAHGITSKSGFVSIEIPQQLPENVIKLVVTKQNFLRFEGEINVIPAEESYVSFVKYSLNEDNGIIEYNEEVSFNFLLKNMGIKPASNIEISLSSDDEFITIIDAYESIGDMAANQEISISQVFTISTSYDIPDNHKCSFIFTATDGVSVWERLITIKVYAPNIEYSIIRFEEVEGNGNTYLDPGETHMARVEVKNTGRMDFPSGNIVFTSNSNDIIMEYTSFDIDSLSMGESDTLQFEIAVSSSAIDASIASINSLITASPFLIGHHFFFNIGLIVEDWESEGFSSFNWSSSGDADWIIASDFVSEGSFSASSPDLNHSEKSALILNDQLIQDNEITFDLQISSQKDRDMLTFYIDNVKQRSWSGLVLFETFTIAIPEGTHELKWEYAKDAVNSSGLDKVWIDFIIMPPSGSTANTQGKEVQQKTKYFSINPNPNQGFMHLVFYEIHPKQLRIYNSMGRLIMQKSLQKTAKQYHLDVSQLPKGFYSLQIESDKGSISSEKLIIN